MTKQQRHDIDRIGNFYDAHIADRYAATVRHLDALRRDVLALRPYRSHGVPHDGCKSKECVAWRRIAKREGWK